MRRLLPWLENALRRYPWIITLLALVPCAYFAARGTSEMVGAKVFAADTEALARPVPSALASTTPDQAAAQNRHVRDRVAIVHRNVFDSEAGCLDCPDATADVADETAAATNPLDDRIIPPEACDRDPSRVGQPHPPACDTQAKILGAVVSDDDEWSMAFIQATSGGPMMPYRMGQEIESRAISLVSHCPALGAYVLLRPPGQPRCFLAQVMPARPPPTAAPPPPPPPPSGPAPGGALAAALEGIERAGANEFNVRRSTVDRILENQAELMRTTRIMPHEEGGRVVGVQLFGVRGNSLLGRLGMQNGDVLNRINGLEIASPDRALEAYSRLRTSDHLQISITRNGQPVNIDFNIR
ncbi:MAG: type II secretion system protein GspC [Polyangiales bacterium]